MKKQVLIISLLLIQFAAFAQNVFNIIIEDTVANVMNSVIALDTGYVYVTGTGNTNGVRCYSLFFIDNSGNRVWKKLSPVDNNQLWEGWDENFQRHNNEFSLSGGYLNTSEGLLGIHISTFDSLFNLKTFHVFANDTSWKKVFHHTLTENGDYYLTGQSYDYEHPDQYRLYLMKVDSNWNLCWQKEFGNYVYEYGSYIIETMSGTILSGGATWLTNINNTKWYILNTDTSGNILWEHNYGRNNFRNGAVNGLLQTKDSCYLACGGYPAAKYGTGSGEILWDGCLRKISQDGELISTNYYRHYTYYPGGGEIELLSNLNSLIELNSGDLMLLGSSYSYYPRNRGYLIKTDSNGNIKWHRYYYAIDSLTRQQYLTVLQPTTDNGFILAGYGNEYDTHGYDPPQQSWLVKTDSLGLDGLSNVELPELNIDIELSETICMSDTISVYAYIAGKSAPYTIEISTGQAIDSVYYPPTFVPVEIGLTHVDLQWGGETYFEQTITEATLTNHSWGQCIAKPVELYTPTTAGLQEIYITVTDAYGESKTITKEVTVIDCGVESILQNQNSGYKIYPNPAKDRVFVNILEQENASYIEILNSAGQVVLTKNLSSEETEINIKELATGSYVVRVYCGNKIENLRFEKM